VDSTDDAEPRPTDVPGGEVGSAERVDRLETIIELAPVGIGIVDFEGRTGMANEVLRRSLGYSPEEFAAMHFAEFTHADDVQPNLDLLAEMAAGEIDHFQMDKRFIRKDGGILWVDLTASLVRDADGKPDYVIGNDAGHLGAQAAGERSACYRGGIPAPGGASSRGRVRG